MNYIRLQSGFSLLSILISSTLTTIVFSISAHYFILVSNYYIKVQHSFDYMNAKLVARHYLLSDLRAANCVSFVEQRLLISGEQDVYYELRKSIIPPHNHLQAYSLYRGTADTRIEAIAEGITDWRVSLKDKTTQVDLNFKDKSSVRIKA